MRVLLAFSTALLLSCGGAEQSRVNWPTDIAEGRQVCTVIYDLLNNASIDSVAGQFGNDISKEKATAMFVQLKELYGHMESYKITSVETEVLSGAVGVQKKITCFIDVVYSKTKCAEVIIMRNSGNRWFISGYESNVIVSPPQ